MNNNQIVLKIIRNNKRPLSAYDILDKFQRIKRIQPMTVYRSLNILVDQGYIHKSHTNSSYFLCKKSHGEGDITTISICKICGDVEEVVNDRNKMALVLNIMNFDKFTNDNLDQIEISAKCMSCEDKNL